MKAVFGVVVSAAALTSAASAASLYDYLFTTKSFPATASQSVALAEIEKERIQKLVQEVNGVAVVLPTNSAWSAHPGALEALLDEPEGNVRYDLLLSASAAVPLENSYPASALESYAASNGGIIDSAYGTSYFVKNNRVCLAEWSAGSYVEGACANVVGSPVPLDNATIYYIDRLILPGDIEDSIDALLARRRRRRM